jgi:hypothetical protein
MWREVGFRFVMVAGQKGMSRQAGDGGGGGREGSSVFVVRLRCSKETSRRIFYLILVFSIEIGHPAKVR